MNFGCVQGPRKMCKKTSINLTKTTILLFINKFIIFVDRNIIPFVRHLKHDDIHDCYYFGQSDNS